MDLEVRMSHHTLTIRMAVNHTAARRNPGR
jgi:hypothetical protein